METEIVGSTGISIKLEIIILKQMAHHITLSVVLNNRIAVGGGGFPSYGLE